ncbi:CRP/FNR family transcriptional regulator [Orenia metallireducens]|jgi:CRP/FNR family transcriptional regulator|uniref:CRP/FNR family transcriptional regulator, anaerobic regulatory protein n=1 Tax=Orenia metallireducens TaxID=1413210 RepID=A0A285F4C2_9FIRM|nr:Crp/Fnr family transcriptional regulator [Orenia metallireducens]PRX34903.1 CRP/FNR family transcriptional regulator [Orenia metallireducens]SNY06128.1 CRP/FNR family transcriptional regulator, anaerobic regulatory protein [Orenia metallireducens]
MEKDILKEHPYFSELDSEKLIEISKLIITKSYKKGEIIFFEGDLGESLYLVKSGKVKLIKMVESGEEQIINIVKTGDIFAEVVLFDDGNYPATAITMEDTEVGIINGRDIEKLMYRIPEIALKILKVMSKRLRRAQQRIRNLGLKDTTSRTASALVYLAQEHGVGDETKVEINLSLTQQELASLIGTSRETVSRTLNKFKDEGLVLVSRQKIVIKDLAGLKETI